VPEVDTLDVDVAAGGEGDSVCEAAGGEEIEERKMMRASMALVVLGLCLGVSPAYAQAKQETNVTDLTVPAKTFVSQLERGDFAAAEQPFDATMQKALPTEKLRAIRPPPITRSRPTSRMWLWTTSPRGFRDCIRRCRFLFSHLPPP
jgi:hypothetical protein